jgi:hypothetical protein
VPFKARLSESADLVGEDEDAGGGQERADDDGGGAVLSPVEALVAEQLLAIDMKPP